MARVWSIARALHVVMQDPFVDFGVAVFFCAYFTARFAETGDSLLAGFVVAFAFIALWKLRHAEGK